MNMADNPEPHVIPAGPSLEAQTYAGPAAEQPATPDRWNPRNRTGIMNGIIVLLILTAILAILYAWQLPPFGGLYEQTDNAYVKGQTTVISPQVSGYVSDVPVQDFENVQAGQVLVRIEDRIYGAKVAQARANVLTQSANFDNSTQAQRSREANELAQDAAIANAQASIIGDGLACDVTAPLCADISQFPLKPSILTLRMQVYVYNIADRASLLKPIDDVRFQAALTRVCEHVRAKTAADQRDRLMQIIAEITGCGELILDEVLEHGRKAIEGRRPEVLPIRQGRETVRVPVASIQWIDAAGDYMCIHAGGDTHILRGTMKELEEILDPKLFQRVHRSTIVNLRLVKSLRAHMNGEYFLTLEGGHELKLSRTYRDKVEYFLSGSSN